MEIRLPATLRSVQDIDSPFQNIAAVAQSGANFGGNAPLRSIQHKDLTGVPISQWLHASDLSSC